MARPREFDVDKALEGAVEAFSRYGYAQTSLDILTSAMGVARPSLYNTFGDKHGLFLAALDRYIDDTAGELAKTLQSPGSPLRAIETALGDMMKLDLADKERKGCLALNSALELAPHDAETARRVARAVRRCDDLFADAIERAQKAGEVDARRDPRALARILTGALHALRIRAKIGASRAVLEDILAETCSSLRRGAVAKRMKK